MRSLRFPLLIVLAVAVATAPFLGAQDVVEVQLPPLSSTYLEMTSAVEGLEKTDPVAALGHCEATLPRLHARHERFDAIFWCLALLHGETGQYDRSFDVLRNGQKEGFFYPLLPGEDPFPPFLGELAKLDGFEAFLEEDTRLRTVAEEDARAELLVRTPEGYPADGPYPLLLVLHGGFGSHHGLARDWDSPTVRSKFVVAYFQGAGYAGSYLRSYAGGGLDTVHEALRQIRDKYAVDDAQIFFGGVSAGGRRALELAIEESTAAAGLVLIIPVVPRDLDLSRLEVAARGGLRAALLTGEHDPRLPKQKKLGVWLDEAGVPNRFVVFPGKGHEHPDHFSEQLEVSLSYVMRTGEAEQ